MAAKKKNHKFIYLSVIIVILIVFAIIYISLLPNNAAKVSYNVTISSHNDVVYTLYNRTYLIYLNNTNMTSHTASIYITESPIITNRILELNLPINKDSDIKLGSNYTDLIVTLYNINTNNATIGLHRLNPDLHISEKENYTKYIS